MNAKNSRNTGSNPGDDDFPVTGSWKPATSSGSLQNQIAKGKHNKANNQKAHLVSAAELRSPASTRGEMVAPSPKKK